MTLLVALGVALACLPLSLRRWSWVVAALVAAYAATWSWIDDVKDAANPVYWGLLLAVVVGGLSQAWRSRRVRVWLLATAIAAAGLALTAVWSIAPRTTLRDLLVGFAPVTAVASLVAVRAAVDVSAVTDLAIAFALLGPIAVAVSLLAAALGAEVGDQLGGVSGVFNGPNYLGALVALTLPFLLAARPVVTSPAMMLAVCGGFSLLVAVSGARAALVGVLAGSFVVVLGASRRRILVAGAAACILAASALVAVWSPSLPTIGEPTGLVGEAGGSAGGNISGQRGRTAEQSRVGALLGGRDEAWREGAALVGRRPVLGNGFGTGELLYEHYGVRGRFHSFVGVISPRANQHDSYLQAVLELGVVGALLFLAPLAAAAFLGGRQTLRRRASTAEVAFTGSLVAGLCIAVFESSLTETGAITMLTWVAAGALLGRAAERRLASSPRRCAPSTRERG